MPRASAAWKGKPPLAAAARLPELLRRVEARVFDGGSLAENCTHELAWDRLLSEVAVHLTD
jgi:hypothetical protein